MESCKDFVRRSLTEWRAVRSLLEKNCKESDLSGEL